MNNSYGEIFRITTFGESHGAAVGVVIDGMVPGVCLTESVVQRELDRRRPGQSQVSSARRETDEVEFLSGVFEGKSTGTPLAMLIRNRDVRSRDYDNLRNVFRPGHADFGYFAKFGIRDYRGGGRSSGRETAGRVAAGAVAKAVLKQQYGVDILAYTLAAGGVRAKRFLAEEIERNMMRCADPDAVLPMLEAVREAMRDGDSVGGLVECRISGVPAGWGEPVFDKLDAELGKAMLSLGGVKGVEFGDGFAVAARRGSENNDAVMPGGGTSTNHAGGVVGGISNGSEIIFRMAVKPTPSIAKRQLSADAAGNAVELEIRGRHDPCLCPRLVPVVESMASLVLMDMALRQRARTGF